MKIKFFPAIIQKNQIQNGIKLTDQELALYRQEKLLKDIQFFESATPYLFGFTIGIVGVMLTLGILNKRHEKKTGESLYKKIYLNLLDIEEVEL